MNFPSGLPGPDKLLSEETFLQLVGWGTPGEVWLTSNWWDLAGSWLFDLLAGGLSFMIKVPSWSVPDLSQPVPVYGPLLQAIFSSSQLAHEPAALTGWHKSGGSVKGKCLDYV